MKQWKTCILALCLALCLVLSGCSGLDFAGYFEKVGDLFDDGNLTPFSQMSYSRPDMEQFERSAGQYCQEAAVQTDLEAMLALIYGFNALHDDFYTNYSYAMIRYSKDQTNAHWTGEYQYCAEQCALVDSFRDQFYRVLAKSPLRSVLESPAYFGPDFFKSYEGPSLYDDYFMELLQQETMLENAYYDLIAQAGENFGYNQSFYDTYGQQVQQLFVQLVQVRQEQARYAGFDSYPEFAYTFYYGRDYSVEDAIGYLADIRAELAPLYQKLLADGVDVTLYACSRQEMFDYVRKTAQSMGGQIVTAFSDMDRAGLYDIGYGENKLDMSFEVYLPNYRCPYVFVNPTGTTYDQLTFVHEFGHFCKDYCSMGSGVTIDVAEIFSQGMEYLSLSYGPADPNMTRLKLVDSLCVYVEQAAYSSFELQVYGLVGEDLTAENVQALYDRICTGYGMTGSWRYVLIPHFFVEPMYVISYVVSNDAALQLYQMEKAKSGSGLACLQESFTARSPYFLAFLEEAGLESPFAPGRIQRVKETLQSILRG